MPRLPIRQKVIRAISLRTGIISVIFLGQAGVAGCCEKAPEAATAHSAPSGAQEYTAVAKFRVLRDRVTVAYWATGSKVEQLDADLGFQVTVEVMRSREIIRSVAKRVRVEDRSKVASNYVEENFFTDPQSHQALPALMAVMAKCLTITPDLPKQIITVEYKNPDRETALKMATLFAEEILRANDEETVGPEGYTLVRWIKTQADQIHREIGELKARATAPGDTPVAERDSIEREIRMKEALHHGVMGLYEREREKQEPPYARYIRILANPAIADAQAK